jgi:hypothetical protein
VLYSTISSGYLNFGKAVFSKSLQMERLLYPVPKPASAKIDPYQGYLVVQDGGNVALYIF